MDGDLVTPSDYFERGMEHLEEGRFKAALECFRTAIERDFFSSDIHLPMGEALFELGHFEEALAEFNRASDEDASSLAELLLWKGSCYFELGKLRRAISAFNRAIEADKNFAEAHLKRGMVLFETGSPDRALAAFETSEGLLDVGELEPRAEISYWKGRSMLRLGRRQEGLGLLYEACETAPHIPHPYTEIADCFRAYGDLRSAAQWYEKGLARLPDDPSINNDYGNLLREQGQLAKSLKHITYAIEHDASREVAYYNRALTLERMGRADDALKDYDTVVEANPDDVDARLRKVDLLAQLGLFVDAHEILGEMTEEERAGLDYQEAAARVFHREAQKAEKHADLDRTLHSHQHALDLHPDFLDVETPADPDDSTPERLRRLIRLVSSVPRDDKREGLATLLEGAARFALLRGEHALKDRPDVGPVRRRSLVLADAELVGLRLHRALELGCENALALKLLAELNFYELKRDDRALEFAEQSLLESPDFVGGLWIKAVILAEGKQQPELAIECYRRMLEITPDNSTVLLNLGDLFFDGGRPHRALAYYRRVLEERPGEIEVNRDIGHCYLALQRYGEAIVCFNRLEARDELALDIQLDLAEAHLAVGDRAEAEKQIREVHDANEGLDPVIDARGLELDAALALARRNPRRALKLARTIPEESLSSFGLLQRARARILLNDLDLARDDLQSVLDDLDPQAADSIEAHYHMARIEFAQGDHDRARALLESLLETSPLEQRAYRLKGWIEMLAGDLDASDETAEAWKFAQLVARVHRLLQYEEYTEALATAEELSQDTPDRVEPRYYRACALAQLGEDEQALDEVRLVLKRAPELKERLLDEFYLEPLKLKERPEFRSS